MNFNEFKKVIRSKLKDDKRFRIAYEDKKYIWIGTKNGLIVGYSVLLEQTAKRPYS